MESSFVIKPESKDISFEFAHGPIQIPLDLAKVYIFRVLIAKVVVMISFLILIVYEEQPIVDTVGTALQLLNECYITCRWETVRRYCLFYERDCVVRCGASRPCRKHLALGEFPNCSLPVVSQIICVCHVTMMVVVDILHCTIAERTFSGAQCPSPTNFYDILVSRSLYARRQHIYIHKVRIASDYCLKINHFDNLRMNELVTGELIFYGDMDLNPYCKK
jgi:hypothetical protein